MNSPTLLTPEAIRLLEGARGITVTVIRALRTDGTPCIVRKWAISSIAADARGAMSLLGLKAIEEIQLGFDCPGCNDVYIVKISPEGDVVAEEGIPQDVKDQVENVLGAIRSILELGGSASHQALAPYLQVLSEYSRRPLRRLPT